MHSAPSRHLGWVLVGLLAGGHPCGPPETHVVRHDHTGQSDITFGTCYKTMLTMTAACRMMRSLVSFRHNIIQWSTLLLDDLAY